MVDDLHVSMLVTGFLTVVEPDTKAPEAKDSQREPSATALGLVVLGDTTSTRVLLQQWT